MNANNPIVTPAAILSLYPALKSLSAEELADLCAPSTVLFASEDGELFSESQPCRGFPLLIEGIIKVVKSTPSGRELLLYRVEPGGSCVISSSCLLSHSPYNARGIAQTKSRLINLPKPLFDRLMSTSADFRDFVFHLLTERISNLMQLVEEVAFHRLDQRLARLLLSKDEPIQTTHQALADELGSVREIVSRLLKNFADQGLVSLGRERILILSRDDLKRQTDTTGSG